MQKSSHIKRDQPSLSRPAKPPIEGHTHTGARETRKTTFPAVPCFTPFRDMTGQGGRGARLTRWCDEAFLPLPGTISVVSELAAPGRLRRAHHLPLSSLANTPPARGERCGWWCLPGRWNCWLWVVVSIAFGRFVPVSASSKTLTRTLHLLSECGMQ